MKHITFDLETLGNACTAPIVQLAAVHFDPVTGDTIDSFNVHIKPESLKRYGLVPELGTVYWWLTQTSEQAKANVFVPGYEGKGLDLKLALTQFREWTEKQGEDRVFWSHATFDPPILEYNARQCGLKHLLYFRAHRDIRTLTHFAGKIEIRENPVQHDAMEDCYHQAEYISAGLQRLKAMEEASILQAVRMGGPFETMTNEA